MVLGFKKQQMDYTIFIFKGAFMPKIRKFRPKNGSKNRFSAARGTLKFHSYGFSRGNFENLLWQAISGNIEKYNVTGSILLYLTG